MTERATGWVEVEGGPATGCGQFAWGDDWPFVILIVLGTYIIFVPIAIKLLFVKKRVAAMAVYAFICLFLMSFLPPWCGIAGMERPYRGLALTADMLMLAYICGVAALVHSRVPHSSFVGKMMYSRAAAPSEGFAEKEYPLWTPINEMKALSVAEVVSLVWMLVWLTFVVVMRYLELTHPLEPNQQGLMYMTETELALVDGRGESAMRARAFGRSINHATLRLIFMTIVSVPRNTVSIHLLGLPFDRAVMYHKLFARAATVLLFVHLGCMLGGGTEAGSIKWDNTFSLYAPSINLWPGVVAFFGYNALWITSLPGVRRRMFEAFYFLHWQFLPVATVFTVLHNVRVAVPWIVLSFAGIWIDFAARIFAKTQTIKAVKLECLGGGIVRIVLGMPADWPLGAFDYHPGCYIFLSIGGPDSGEANRDLFQTVNAAGAPVPSWLLFHPITVTHFDREAATIELIIKDLTWVPGVKSDATPPPENWAGQLVEAARRIELGTMQLDDLGFHVGGPNGKSMIMQPLEEMGAICLISAGVGITPMLAIYLDLQEKRCTSAVPPISFAWATRTAEELAALAPYLGADATVYFTGSDAELEAFAPPTEGKDGASFSLVRGRPNANAIVETSCATAAAATTKDPAVAILCCGPPALMDAVERASYAARSAGTNALFHREAFLW